MTEPIHTEGDCRWDEHMELLVPQFYAYIYFLVKLLNRTRNSLFALSTNHALAEMMLLDEWKLHWIRPRRLEETIG